VDVQAIGVISQERLKTEVKLLLNANRKSYMPCRLAQQRTTLSDSELLFHPHRALSLRELSFLFLKVDHLTSTGVIDVTGPNRPPKRLKI